jgi:hypothetical protein
MVVEPNLVSAKDSAMILLNYRSANITVMEVLA